VHSMWLPWVLGAAIVVGYGTALWWWVVCDATPAVRTALVAICGVALALRVVYTTDYPAGLNQDEPKNLACSVRALAHGELFTMACNGVPYLLSTLFAAPLVPVLGFGRWAMRSYSIALSVLSPLAAYAVGRAMAFDAVASLAVGGLVAVLPWSIFYGRVSLGGELVFHQLLLLTALARLIWAERAGWREALIGGGALCLLLYDYYSGRAMVGMPLVAAVLAGRGWRRRGWCLLVLALAGLGWLPYWRSGPQHDALIVRALLGQMDRAEASTILHPDLVADPLAGLWARGQLALRVFVEPVAQLSIWTVPAGALHPLAVLATAGLGVLLTSMRRKLFLLAGFVGGVLPGVLSEQFSISTHRLLMAYPFVAMAAGAAVAALPWRSLRAASATILLAAATVSSVRLYFSSTFWTPDARYAFNADETALAERLADLAPAHVVASPDMLEFLAMPEAGPPEPLSTINWWPPVAATYVFGPTYGSLAPIYHRLFPGQVEQFGKGFLVSIDGRSLGAALGSNGWQQRITCGDTVAQAGVVPAIFTVAPPADPACRTGVVTYAWRGYWDGPAANVRLDYSGAGRVTINGQTVLEEEGVERRIPFALPHGSDVTIEIVSAPTGPRAALLELLPAGMRLPSPELVQPR
jgi:hypothetical protein